MLQRTLLLFFAFLYPAFWVIFKYTKAPIDDPRQRIVIAILCFIGFKLYNSENLKIRKNQNSITYTGYYLVTLHSLYLAYLNNFTIEFQVQIFIIILFASLGFARKYHLFYYLFFTFFCFIPITVSGFMKLEIYFILCTLLLVCIGAFVIQIYHIRFLKQLLVNDRILLSSVDKLNDGIIITDTTSHVLFVNDVAQKLLDFNSEFLIGSRINLPIPSESRLTGNMTIIHTVEDRMIEIRMIKVERLGRPAFFIILKDITQAHREKVETERMRILRESILVNAKEAIIGIDKEGNIMYASPFALELTDYSETELLGKSFHETFHHSWMDGIPHNEENSPILDTLATGEVHRISNEIFWKKNEKYFYVEYSSSPIKNDDSIEGAVLLFKDISEKKKKIELENRYNEELIFLSESAMQFLQMNSLEEVFDYIGASIFEFAKPRAVIVNSFNPINSEFKVESIKGFKQFIGPIVKLINCELIGVNYSIDHERLPQFKANFNKLLFLPDGLYGLNFGNLNRKECLMIESMLNSNRVYTFTISDNVKILGSVIILYEEEKFPFETMLEIFLHQASIAVNKFPKTI